MTGQVDPFSLPISVPTQFTEQIKRIDSHVNQLAATVLKGISPEAKSSLDAFFTEISPTLSVWQIDIKNWKSKFDRSFEAKNFAYCEEMLQALLKRLPDQAQKIQAQSTFSTGISQKLDDSQNIETLMFSVNRLCTLRAKTQGFIPDSIEQTIGTLSPIILKGIETITREDVASLLSLQLHMDRWDQWKTKFIQLLEQQDSTSCDIDIKNLLLELKIFLLNRESALDSVEFPSFIQKEDGKQVLQQHLLRINQSLDALFCLSTLDSIGPLTKTVSELLLAGTSRAKEEQLERFCIDATKYVVEPKEGWQAWLQHFSEHYGKAEFPSCDDELRSYAAELKDFFESAQIGCGHLNISDQAKLDSIASAREALNAIAPEGSLSRNLRRWGPFAHKIGALVLFTAAAAALPIGIAGVGLTAALTSSASLAVPGGLLYATQLFYNRDPATAAAMATGTVVTFGIGAPVGAAMALGIAAGKMDHLSHRASIKDTAANMERWRKGRERERLEKAKEERQEKAQQLRSGSAQQKQAPRPS